MNCKQTAQEHPRSAEWDSAIQHIENLRYAFGQVLGQALNTNARGPRALPTIRVHALDAIKHRCLIGLVLIILAVSVSSAWARLPRPHLAAGTILAVDRTTQTLIF